MYKTIQNLRKKTAFLFKKNKDSKKVFCFYFCQGLSLPSSIVFTLLFLRTCGWSHSWDLLKSTLPGTRNREAHTSHQVIHVIVTSHHSSHQNRTTHSIDSTTVPATTASLFPSKLERLKQT